MSKTSGSKPSGRILVTPAMAKTWLERNTRNRSMRWAKVREFAATMLREEWEFIGDSVDFDVDGTLTNGQHRLAACVDSGVAIELNVVWDVPVSSFKKRDKVLVRTYSDSLHIIGEKNCSVRSAMVTAAYGYEHSNPCGKLSTDTYRGTIDQFELYREEHPTVDAFADTSWLRPTRVRGLSTTQAGLVWYAFERAGFKDKADSFFSILCGETEANRYHPARMLPERFMQAKLARHSLRISESVTYCVRAFNAFVDGKLSLQKLYGDISEVTPSFTGWPRGLCRNDDQT